MYLQVGTLQQMYSLKEENMVLQSTIRKLEIEKKVLQASQEDNEIQIMKKLLEITSYQTSQQQNLKEALDDCLKYIKQNNIIQNQLEVAKNKINKLDSELVDKKKQNEQLKSNIQDKQQQIEEFQNQLKTNKTEILRLNNLLKIKIISQEKLQQDLLRLQVSNEAFTEKFKEQGKINENLNKTIENLNINNQKQKLTNEKQNKTIEQQTEILDQLVQTTEKQTKSIQYLGVIITNQQFSIVGGDYALILQKRIAIVDNEVNPTQRQDILRINLQSCIRNNTWEFLIITLLNRRQTDVKQIKEQLMGFIQYLKENRIKMAHVSEHFKKYTMTKDILRFFQNKNELSLHEQKELNEIFSQNDKNPPKNKFLMTQCMN